MQKTIKNSKPLHAESGFTLVELIIAIAIMVLLLGAAITYFPAYRNQQVLRQGSLDVNNSLRQTQTLAFSPDDDNSDYYVWEVKEGGADVGCLTEKYISIMSQVAETAGDDPVNVLCLDDKVIMEGDIDKLYFQMKTGKIFADAALTIPAYGQIEVKHSAMRDVGDYYYNIGIYNDSFDLLSSDVGQIRDLPGEPPTDPNATTDGDDNQNGDGGGTTDGDNDGDNQGEYTECVDNSDCLEGCLCVTSESNVKYCDCSVQDQPSQPYCGNDILETGEQCGEEGAQCPTGQECQSCKCVTVEQPPRCGDKKINQTWEQCEQDIDCATGESCVDCICEEPQVPAKCGDGKINQDFEQCESNLDCSSNEECDNECQCVSLEYCGDGRCTGNENNQSCSKDCPVVCGDGYCNENAGESYTSCDADCEAPPIDPRCDSVWFCSNSSQCYGGTCKNYRCDCSLPVDTNLKTDGSSCDTGSECQSGYCVRDRCSSNSYLCRYFPQWCS